MRVASPARWKSGLSPIGFFLRLFHKVESSIQDTVMNDRNSDEGATKRSALLVTTLAAFLTPFGISSVNIALPSIGREFLMDAILLGWVITVYLLASAMFLVPFGRVADIYGRKRIFTYGIIVFSFGSLGSALSNSAATLICFRILQGIGAAAIFPVGAAILTSAFPSSELGRVLGINVVAVYLGYSVGPFLGGLLTHHFGWRSIFLANVIAGLIVISFTCFKLKGEWREARDEKFDLAGSIIYSIILLLIMYGFSKVTTVLGMLFVLLGFSGVWVFIKWEMKTKSPVLEINLFRRNRVFAFSILATLINSGAAFAVTFLLSLYLQYIRGLTPEHAGLILISQPIVQGLVSPVSGRISDRISPRIVASIGIALTGLGIFLLTILSERTALVFIVANLGLLGLSFALFSVPNANAVMSSVENRFYGVASGTLSTMRITGMAFSMGIALLIFSTYLGKVQIGVEHHALLLRSIKVAFSLFAIFCLGGAVASFAGNEVR